MTKPEAKKRGPKPKPKVTEPPAGTPVSDEDAANAAKPRDPNAGDPVHVVIGVPDDSALTEPVTNAVPANVSTEHSDPDANPEPIRLPLIDGKPAEWAASVIVGPRSVCYIARLDVSHDELAHTLKARTVTVDTEPLDIAARVITPPHLSPVRVTYTVRERIA